METSPDPQWRDDPKAALDPHKAHIVGVSFSIAACDAVYIPVHHIYGRNSCELDIFTVLCALVANPSVTKVAHNPAFEAAFLYALGIVIQPPVYDTIAAAQLTLKGQYRLRSLSDSGLKTLMPELFYVELPTFDEVTAGQRFDELDPDDPATVAYACADADYAFRLREFFNDWFARFMPKHRCIVE
ncbi:MAG: hypothetical protein LBS11_00685 [Oscillospiraceae bacterium]|nr:hypothetical protein [Oscillospiraceae bacterium]